MGKKTKFISARVSEEEHARILALNRELGITSSDVLRAYYVETERTKLVKKELNQLYYEINKISVNINQIAKANNGGYYSANDIKELKEGLRTIIDKMDGVIFAVGGA